MSLVKIVAVAAAAAVLGRPASAEILRYVANLSGAAEAPTSNAKGTGFADVSLDTDTRVISWRITFSGLSGPATMAHFHGPANIGMAGPVSLTIPAPLSSPLTGTAPVDYGQIGDLRAGRWYLNIHTAANPKGELRGQLTRAR